MKKIIGLMLLMNVLFADVTTLTSGVSASGSVTLDEMNYYKISALEGQSVKAVLDQLMDDGDLYVKIGSEPTKASYDCRSIRTLTSDEDCSTTLDMDSDVYIGVYGYRATDYRVVATVEGQEGSTIPTLSSGTAVVDTVSNGETKFYKIPAVQGQQVASLLDGLSADADLYVRLGAKPTGQLFDCKSTNGGVNSDGCSITVEERGDVYLAVYGYQAADYTLKATVTGDDTQTLSSGETVSDSVFQDEMKYYKINALFGQDIEGIINQLTADADIYIKKGSQPTTSSYDCKSTNGGTTADSCSLTVLDDMEVFIGVYGFRATQYNLTVTAISEPVPAQPTVLEDAEGGTLNPNWITAKGDRPGYIYPTPNIPGAPSGNGVLVQHASGSGVAPYRYELPLNNTTQRVLSMDMGGLPSHKYSDYPESLRGYIPHYSVGVIVETKFGQRFMDWNSWYTHQGYEPRIHDNGENVFLEYPSPVEMVRGWYAPTDLWVHFEVDLDEALRLLEPDNRIYKIVQFYTTGGYLDNITLSSAE